MKVKKMVFTMVLLTSLIANLVLWNRVGWYQDEAAGSYNRALSFTVQRMKEYIEAKDPNENDYYVILSYVYCASTYSKVPEQSGALYLLWNGLLYSRTAVEPHFSEVYQCIKEMEKNPDSIDAGLRLQSLVMQLRSN